MSWSKTSPAIIIEILKLLCEHKQNVLSKANQTYNTDSSDRTSDGHPTIHIKFSIASNTGNLHETWKFTKDQFLCHDQKENKRTTGFNMLKDNSFNLMSIFRTGLRSTNKMIQLISI